MVGQEILEKYIENLVTDLSCSIGKPEGRKVPWTEISSTTVLHNAKEQKGKLFNAIIQINDPYFARTVSL